MRYCKECVQSDTRPGIYFSPEGVCGACLWEKEKEHIDWASRERELQDIADNAKAKASGPYDCAVGVSGGKDSTFQALYARDRLGLRPLLVNCQPENITDIGRHNIENLKKLGFDVVSLRPNPKIMYELIRRDFFDCLNPLRVTEYPLWASTYTIATHFNIPMVLQGENPGQTLGIREYTGTGGDALSILRHNTIKEDPLKRYCVDGIDSKDLFMYRIDRDAVLEKGIKAVWLSYYAKEWSQPHNAQFAINYGLKIKPDTTDPYAHGAYRRFGGLDGRLVEVNQLFKYIKFGFGQTTDLACYDIRDGLVTRDEGVFLVKELDGRCADSFIIDFCKYIDISPEKFWKHVNSFRGSMWENDNGEWILSEPVWEQFPVQGAYTVAALQKRLRM